MPILITVITIYWPGLFMGHDVSSQTLRLTSLCNEIKHGQILPLFDYWGQYQIGYSWQIFYPPLTNIYFLIASLFFHGSSIIMKMKFVLLQINIINCLCAFYAAKRQYNSYFSAFFCVALLLTTSYYSTLYITRFALSEFASIGFIFLFIRGLDSLCTDKKDIYLIPISSSLVVLTNIPSAINLIFFSIIYILINYKVIISKKNVLFLIQSVFLTVLIISFYTVPLIYNSANKYIFMTSNHFSYQQFYSFSAPVSSVFFDINKINYRLNATIPISIGVTGLLSIIYLLIFQWSREKHRMLIIIIIMLAYTSIFPWWLLPDSLPIFNIAQFPWRLASIAICITALWCSSILSYKKNYYIFCSVLLLVALILNGKGMVQSLTQRNLNINSGFPTIIYPDYLNNNIMKNHIVSPYFLFNPLISSDIKSNNIEKTSPNYTFKSSKIINGFPQYEINVIHDTMISLPIIYYKSVKIISDHQTLSTIYMQDGTIGVYLKEGQYTLHISYKKQHFLMGSILSILGVLWLLYAIRKNKKTHYA